MIFPWKVGGVGHVKMIYPHSGALSEPWLPAKDKCEPFPPQNCGVPTWWAQGVGEESPHLGSQRTSQHCRMGKKRSCCLHWSWRTEQGLKVHVALVLDRVFWLHPHASGSTISWNPCHLVHWNWWHAERSSPGNHWWRPHGSLTWHWHTSASPAGGEPGPSGIIGTNISAIGVTVCQRLWHPKLLTFVNKLYHRC